MKPVDEIVTFPEMATLIGLSVALELAAVAEEQSGPEDAIVSWALSRPDRDPDLCALAGFVERLSADMLAAVTLGRAA